MFANSDAFEHCTEEGTLELRRLADYNSYLTAEQSMLGFLKNIVLAQEFLRAAWLDPSRTRRSWP